MRYQFPDLSAIAQYRIAGGEDSDTAVSVTRDAEGRVTGLTPAGRAPGSTYEMLVSLAGAARGELDPVVQGTCAGCGALYTPRYPSLFHKGGCVIGGLVSVLIYRGEMEPLSVANRLANLDDDALWRDLGPIIDRLAAGAYDVGA